MKFKEALKNVADVPNKFNTSGGTLTGALKLKGTTMTSSINCNKTTGREELQIYAAGDAYMEGSKGSGIHLYGNNDAEHSGNIAFLTGDNNAGTARMIVSQKGNVTVGHAIWDFVDTNKDIGLLNVKGVSGKTAMIFHSVNKADGEIAVPTGENFTIGHVDTSTNKFTAGFEITSAGNAYVNRGDLYVKNNKVFHAGSTEINLSGKMTISKEKLGCVISPDGLDGISYGSYFLGDSVPLGYITCMGVAQMSDRETKEEIKYINNNEEKITSEDCYDFFLNKFKPVSFKYKKRSIDSPELGFIAQDIEETKLSDFILIKKENQPLSFNNYSFTSALAIAFQKAIKEIEELKEEINILKNKN